MSPLLQCLVNTELLSSALSRHGCTSMQNQRAAMGSVSPLLSPQEEKEGADPDLLQCLVLLSQRVGWPELARSTVVQKHWYWSLLDCAGEELLMTTSCHQSRYLIWSHGQIPKCVDNIRTPLWASLIFSSWNHKFCCCFWKILHETHYKVNEVWILPVCGEGTETKPHWTPCPCSIQDRWRGSTGEPHAASLAAQTCPKNQEFLIFAASQLTGS